MKRFIIGILISSSLMIRCDSTASNSKEQIFQKTAVELIEPKFQDGDLIFHTSKSSQSEAIQIATNSKYSHMGIVFKTGNEIFVYEAIQPVKYTKLDDWINRGVDGKYIVKRLKNSTDFLDAEGIKKMKSIGQKYFNKDYDLKFEWSDDKIYCSELVWKMYKETFNIEIGHLEKIGDFDLSDETVQIKLKERYGDKIPADELVITPDRMFHAKNLIRIEL